MEFGKILKFLLDKKRVSEKVSWLSILNVLTFLKSTWYLI